MAIIDPTVIKQLVETQLGTISTSVVPAGRVYFAGVTRPDEQAIWVELVAIDLTTSPRPRGGPAQDEPDYAEIVVSVNIFCSAEQMALNSHSLTSVQAEVIKALSQATLRETASGPHRIDLTDFRTVQDARDSQRHTHSGAVIATGIASRASGSSMAVLVT